MGARANDRAKTVMITESARRFFGNKSPDDGQTVDSQLETVKILEWDPGKYLRQFKIYDISNFKMLFLASAFHASVANGIFTRLDWDAHARAKNVMSTGSTTTFEWSVTLSGPCFNVGIASQLTPEETHVSSYDSENVIYYHADTPKSSIRSPSKFYPNLRKYKAGDIIHFRFDPQRKKLVINAIRNVASAYQSQLQFKDKHEIELQDNINYFPYIRSWGGREGRLVR